MSLFKHWMCYFWTLPHWNLVCGCCRKSFNMVDTAQTHANWWDSSCLCECGFVCVHDWLFFVCVCVCDKFSLRFYFSPHPFSVLGDGVVRHYICQDRVDFNSGPSVFYNMTKPSLWLDFVFLMIASNNGRGKITWNHLFLSPSALWALDSMRLYGRTARLLVWWT